jgi:hypothetical protein
MLSLALLVGSADVAGAKAVKVTPTVSVTSAAVKGKKVTFAVYHALGLEVQGCAGKVKMSHKISKKQTKSWSGSLKTSTLGCGATIHASLPKANFNKKLKFTSKFAGNSKIKKFSITKSLKLSPPPPPTTPTPGPVGPPASKGPQAFGKWLATRTSDDQEIFRFTIKAPDYAVPGFTNWLGFENILDCGAGNETTHVPFNWNQAFALGGQVGKAESEDTSVHTSHLLYVFNFSFANQNEGSGNFSANGGFEVSTGVFKSCHTALNFKLQWTGPEF